MFSVIIKVSFTFFYTFTLVEAPFVTLYGEVRNFNTSNYL